MKDKDELIRDITFGKSEFDASQEEIAMLYDLFEEYRDAYVGEWERLRKCDKLYRGAHWDDIPSADSNEPRPVTPVIQSTVENVRAELSDYYPEAVICADDRQYDKAAELLTAVIRENHLACDYEAEYEKILYDLLVGGYAVQEVGYDPEMCSGLGGSYIRHCDVRNIMFDPCAVRVEDCRAIFKFSAHSYSWFKMHYPKFADSMIFDEYTLKSTSDDILHPNRGDESLLIECWFREYDAEAGKYRVHMIKMAGRTKLEDSRTHMSEGIYAHGNYPFTVTKLFTRKGSCLGYGYADMFEKQQVLSDKLDQIVLKNALMASHNKLLVSSASGFDVNDLRDWSKEVHRGENINGLKWFSTAPLPSYIIDYVNLMRDSVREESGTNDFSRGQASGGVVAASAISALIEMSTKRARGVAKRLHRSFADAVRMEIETERQYSVYKRPVYLETHEPFLYSCAVLNDEDEYPLEFRVTVKVQKENRFSVLAHNETIMNLVEKGMLTPDVGLELLIFDGKQEALQKMKAKREEDAGFKQV